MGALGSDEAIGAILKWSQRDDWSERRATLFADHFGPVLEDFEITIEEVIDLLEPAGFMQLLACALEDFMTCNFEPDQRNVVDDYLKRRGWKESAPVKSWLRGLQRSVMSAYEVVETAPGSHFVVRDLIRGGEPIQVEDKLGSQDLIQWDRIAARLLEIKGKTYLSAGVLRLSFDDAAEIVGEIGKLERKLLQQVRKALKEEGVTAADLEGLPAADAVLGEMAPLFTHTWLTTTLEQLLGKSLPEFRNFDGDAVQFCETCFPVLERDSLEQIAAGLDGLAGLTRDAADRSEWSWTAASPSTGEPARQAGSDHGRKLRGLAEEGAQLLGSVHLEPDALVLETNSAERAERGRDLLTAALGSLLGPPLTSTRTPAQVMAERGMAAPGASEAQLSLSLEEESKAVQHVIDRHYRATLNAPVPALGGKTPKQAVRSKAGRDEAARWLKFLENQTARRAKVSGQPGYDFTWMWDALKINDLRR